MSVTDEFGFNARQYFDFNKEQDDVPDDSFFEIAREDITTESNNLGRPRKVSEDVVERVEISDTESDAAYFSPLDYTRNAGISGATMHLEQDSKVRRSLSLSNLATESHLQQLMEESNINEPERPSSSCAYNPKKRWMSKENINRLAQPKTFTSSDKGRFTSLAEAVNKFQASTPTRFRSKSSQKLNKVGMTIGCTKPNSPKLSTAARARPLSVTALSREDRELLEMEEAKKFKIRARPVNQRAMKGPLKTQVEKKPPTAVEPFHLTEIKKKEVEEVNVAPLFKAQPLPKSLYKPFKINEVAQPTTKPQSPKITKVPPKHTPKKQSSEKIHNTERASRLSVTRPLPFSFEKRDQQLVKKKEEFINKVLEEEKKAREFHAKPPPKAVLRARNCSTDRASTVSSTKNSKGGSAEELDMTFKARPATVLMMKPFEPKKDETHVLVTQAFHFLTDGRLEARHKLEEQRRENEEKLAEYERRKEESLKKMEEEEVAKLRKLAEHKAQPIRKYKEVVIKPSNKVTQPISPIFHTDRIRNKENLGE